ncbi:MAG: DMT family transporter [Chloroflexi bacterium]|nr:DMT family transporter [Chloroflexota bacterium]
MDSSAARLHARNGIVAALFSATVLGLAPIFGKLALREGMDPLALVLLRTVSAAIILWVIFLLFGRKYIFIYPVGFIACAVAGIINGIGSLFFYSGLAMLDASLAQLLYSINPIILVFLLRLDGQPISRITFVRMILAVPAVYLLTSNTEHVGQLQGVVFMLIGAAAYALHLAITQRTLRDMPSQTVTLYTLSVMAITVAPWGLWAIWTGTPLAEASDVAWAGVIGLTLATAMSRLSLFVGVKRLGGMQAALLGLSELLVSLISALIFFNEQLTITQWSGAIILIVSVGLIGREPDLASHYVSYGWLGWMYGLFERLHPQPEPPPLRSKKATK